MIRFFFILFVFLIHKIAFCQDLEFERKIENIELVSIQGDELQPYDLLKKSKGKILILEFWETWCIPCVEAMEHLHKLKTAYPKDLKVVCVASENLSKVRNFLDKKSYDFDFVFDSKSELKSIFPHRSIPHTIIVDQSGKIQSETLPNFFTAKEVEKLLIGNSIDLPKKINVSDSQEEPSTDNLLNFQLSNSNLGDVRMVNISNYQNNKKIIKNYFDGSFVDTLETIIEYDCKVQNILELYRLAYGNLSKYNFVFPKELNYIDYSNPSDSYNLKFSSSSLFGNSDELLINQLNAAFGLKSEKRKIDTTVLVIKDIESNNNSIIKSVGKQLENYQTFMLQHDSLAVNGYISAKAIVNLIESRLKQRVELDPSLDDTYYEVNLSIKSDTQSLQEWIALLNKEGIYFEEKRKEFVYIDIKNK